MANTLNLGTNGNWATKEDSLLAYNSENGNFKPLPFDFTRASNATVVNKAGLIETVGSGEPRIDFKDNTKGALLLEPTRGNLFLNSEPTSNESSAGGITYESFNWFLGFSNCIKFGDNSSVRYRYGGSVSASTQYTVSAFVIMDDLSEPLVGSGSSVGDFSFVAGGIVGGVVNSNVYYGNNVYRVSTTLTSGSNLGNNGVIKYTTQSSKGFRVVGLQLEQGSYATSYIPTSGSAVTRSEDACNNGGNEQVINSTEGVLYVETKGFIDVPSSSEYIQLSKNGESSATNSLVIQQRNNGYLRIYVNGFGNADIHFNVNIDFTENHKIAVLYKLNGYKLFIDGVSQSLFGTPTQAVFSGLNNLSFDLRGALRWNGSIKDARVYNTALTDAELIALTTI